MTDRQTPHHILNTAGLILKNRLPLNPEQLMSLIWNTLTSWPSCLKFERCSVFAAIRDKTKVLSNNIPPNSKHRATWPKYVPVRTGRCSDASCKETSILGSTFGLFYDARVCASTSWPTFSLFQPISGVISAFSKHWEKRKRDGEGEGRRESRWATPRPHVPAQSGKDRLCERQTAHFGTARVYFFREWALNSCSVPHHSL